MQERVIRLNVYSHGQEVSSIRRRPRRDDQRLTKAINALHQQGPGLICELWEEVEELKSRLAAVTSPQISKETARTVAARLVDGLRDS